MTLTNILKTNVSTYNCTYGTLRSRKRFFFTSTIFVPLSSDYVSIPDRHCDRQKHVTLLPNMIPTKSMFHQFIKKEKVQKMRQQSFVKADAYQLDESTGSANSKYRTEEAKRLTITNKLFSFTYNGKSFPKKTIKFSYVLVITLTFGLALTVISNFILTLVIQDHVLNPNYLEKKKTFVRRMTRNETNQSQVFPNDRDDHKLDFKNVVHIVHTRFMQNQPDLIHLAKARLELFQTVCLPSMSNQTTQNFVWIILTDPNLIESIKEEMVQLLTPYQNYIFGTSYQYILVAVILIMHVYYRLTSMLYSLLVTFVDC